MASSGKFKFRHNIFSLIVRIAAIIYFAAFKCRISGVNILLHRYHVKQWQNNVSPLDLPLKMFSMAN